MSLLNPRSAPEADDARATLTAAAAGVAALVQSVNVIEVFVSEGTAALLGHLQLAGGILILLLFAPMLIRLKKRGSTAAGHGDGGSYLGALVRRASSTAFSITVVVMILLSVLERRVLAHLSAETTVDLLITFAFAIFALAFFFIDRFGRVDDALGGDA
ncbi:MAG: hypothetical protein RQ745_03045 [Longimicrobiales bacterium]|nr:hypothetical protein [Longimicrobiales bacterium]